MCVAGGAGTPKPLHSPSIHYGKDPVGQVVPVHHLQGGTRGIEDVGGTRSCTGHFYNFQLVPTLGPSTCVQIPFGVRTPQLVRPFLLEQAAAREQASLANLLFCVGVRVGSLRYIPLRKLICIHSLSACTFPVLVIIYLKHYLYSCMESLAYS